MIKRAGSKENLPHLFQMTLNQNVELLYQNLNIKSHKFSFILVK